MGQGLLLPCTMVVSGDKGEVLGVAGIELSLKQFSQDILGFQSMVVETEIMHSLLIAESGEIIATYNSEQSVGETLANEVVLKQIQAGRSGYSLIDDRYSKKLSMRTR